ITRRWPYCWFGGSEKLLGVTSRDRSSTTRRSEPSRGAERSPVTGVLSSASPPVDAAKVAPEMSITMRSGLARVNSVWSAGPVRSKTRRVLSGARQRRTLLISAACTTPLSSMLAPASNAAAYFIIVLIFVTASSCLLCCAAVGSPPDRAVHALQSAASCHLRQP